LKKTIHGFTDELVFEKDYNSIINYVLIYRSKLRKLHNICVVLSKISTSEDGEADGNAINISNIDNMSLKAAEKAHKVK
jgi:hypothetical protein